MNLNKLIKKRLNVIENLQANININNNVSGGYFHQDKIENLNLNLNNSNLTSLKKQAMNIPRTLMHNFYENRFIKTFQKSFSTNISLNEIEQKKKADNNKKTNKTLKEEEKLEKEETSNKLSNLQINNFKTIDSEINKETKTKITNSNKAALETSTKEFNKESELIKISKIKYLKKPNPEIKLKIDRNIKKFFPIRIKKTIYPLVDPYETNLHPNDPFRNFFEESNSKNKTELLEKFKKQKTKNLTNNIIDKKENLASKNKDENKYNKNEDFSEYQIAIETIYYIGKEFDLEKLKYLIDYMLENPLDDGLFLRKLEFVLIENLNRIDCKSKSNLVLIMGKSLQKKKLKYNEKAWDHIFRDFQSLVELPILKFKDFYNYNMAFEKIKKNIFASRPSFLGDFERFVNYDNLSFLNTGKIKLENIDDIILLSSLIHSKIYTFNSISDSVWLSINNLILKNFLKLNINTLLVMTTLLINFSEVSPKVPIILKDTIEELNKFINLVFINFEFLNENEKVNLINFSDSLFNFYLIFIHSNNNLHKSSNIYQSLELARKKNNTIVNNDDFLIQNFIKLYSEKIKLHNHFNFFHELRILIFLSKELKYFDTEFWTLCGDNIKKFLKFDFISKLSDILPKRIGTGISSQSRASTIEIEEMSKLFYYGVIIEVFSTVSHYDKDFWEAVFDKFDEIVPISKKDPLILLQFISLHCKKLYRNKRYFKIYELLVNKFSPEFKRIFINREILDYLIGVNFNFMEFDREKNNRLILNLINPLYPLRRLEKIEVESTNTLCSEKNINNCNKDPNNLNNNVSTEDSQQITDNIIINTYRENFIININMEKSHQNTVEKINIDDKKFIKKNEIKDVTALKKQDQLEISYKFETSKSKFDNNGKVEYEEKNLKKQEPNTILLFITYLNLLWSKSIFEEEVNNLINYS